MNPSETIVETVWATGTPVLREGPEDLLKFAPHFFKKSLVHRNLLLGPLSFQLPSGPFDGKLFLIKKFFDLQDNFQISFLIGSLLGVGPMGTDLREFTLPVSEHVWPNTDDTTHFAYPKILLVFRDLAHIHSSLHAHCRPNLSDNFHWVLRYSVQLALS